jgi:transcription-repair coupling factor (superfamily II helicase)
MSSKLSDVLAKKFNTDFLLKKLSVLEKEPLILKNIPPYLTEFVGECISKISKKSFDIVLCNSEDELKDIVKKYSSGEINVFSYKLNDKFKLKDLEENGFARVKRVSEKGEYSLLGDVLIFWPFNFENPVRVSLFGDTVEKIDVIEKNTFSNIQALKKVEIFTNLENEIFTYGISEQKYAYPLVLFNLDALQLDYGFSSLDLGFRNIPGLEYAMNKKSVLQKVIDGYRAQGYQIFCSSGELRRVKDVLGDQEFSLYISDLEKGFVHPELKVLLLTDYELFGRVHLGSKDWLKQIFPGDFLVHEDHGIGVFERMLGNKDGTYIEIRYAKKDRLLVPISQSEKVSKYIGGRGRVPTLTTLSGGSWRRVKSRVKEDTDALAKELLQIYAMREILKFGLKKEESKLKKELEKFVESFEFKDTYDQQVVTQEIFEDITSGKLMDRLLVGDVGFGKTELAMRAAFLVLNFGMQVALLAPTTILVEQHAAVFKKRLEGSGINVAVLSRFLSEKEKRNMIDDLENGKIDFIIGTHSLLYDRVKFKNLGLIVIDEEQKFGVKQKEKLKQKRLEAHVLSMSATPIPRSLSMSLSGIRDISTLFTPPEGRKSISNTFAPFSWSKVKVAIEKEIARKGQVYFLHNRVFDIQFVEKKLVEIFPLANIAVLHGQMHPDDISRVMNAFCSGKIDILVCTTIIENGIDIPNVNTLIVQDASNFGLSQLYQIRGRIGRSNVQAYAHFFYKSMKGNTGLRLDALMEAQDLGSGFLLANRDLEIRGVGDLLGSAQSGNINAVGYGLFMKFLSDAVEGLK